MEHFNLQGTQVDAVLHYQTLQTITRNQQHRQVTVRCWGPQYLLCYFQTKILTEDCRTTENTQLVISPLKQINYVRNTLSSWQRKLFLSVVWLCPTK